MRVSKYKVKYNVNIKQYQVFTVGRNPRFIDNYRTKDEADKASCRIKVIKIGVPMSEDVDVVFCRSLLAEAHKLVKLHFPDQKFREAWVYSYGRTWEFHGPDGYYWHGRAANAYDARYNGWMRWLAFKGIDLEVKKITEDNE